MAFDEQLGERVRDVLRAQDGVTERKMFGGLAFMVHGNMCVGVTGDSLMVRVGKENYAQTVMHPHARPMDFTGRPMKGFLYVDQPGVADDEGLREWVGRGLAFALSLPPK
jgi:TfoX/Sxy family transcriptional regulator of competence genes